MAFDNNKLGELRPNQIITTFGPGSIVDAVKDSVTVLDTNYWKEKGTKIIDGRLASYLGVDCFYMPRTSYGGDIPVVSFPYDPAVFYNDSAYHGVRVGPPPPFPR